MERLVSTSFNFIILNSFVKHDLIDANKKIYWIEFQQALYGYRKVKPSRQPQIPMLPTVQNHPNPPYHLMFWAVIMRTWHSEVRKAQCEIQGRLSVQRRISKNWNHHFLDAVKLTNKKWTARVQVNSRPPLRWMLCQPIRKVQIVMKAITPWWIQFWINASLHSSHNCNRLNRRSHWQPRKPRSSHPTMIPTKCWLYKRQASMVSNQLHRVPIKKFYKTEFWPQIHRSVGNIRLRPKSIANHRTTTVAMNCLNWDQAVQRIQWERV